jgi:hypothetical protein
MRVDTSTTPLWKSEKTLEIAIASGKSKGQLKIRDPSFSRCYPSIGNRNITHESQIESLPLLKTGGNGLE